jgi:hypothetical protein
VVVFFSQSLKKKKSRRELTLITPSSSLLIVIPVAFVVTCETVLFLFFCWMSAQVIDREVWSALVRQGLDEPAAHRGVTGAVGFAANKLTGEPRAPPLPPSAKQRPGRRSSSHKSSVPFTAAGPTFSTLAGGSSQRLFDQRLFDGETPPGLSTGPLAAPWLRGLDPPPRQPQPHFAKALAAGVGGPIRVANGSGAPLPVSNAMHVLRVKIRHGDGGGWKPPR